MSAIVTGYLAEFDALAEAIDGALQAAQEAHCDRDAATDAMVVEASELMQHAQLHLRSLDAAARRTFADAMQHNAARLATWTQPPQDDRSELVGDAAMRHRMQAATQTLQRTGGTIAAAQRSVFEAEATGHAIQAELSRNRETLQNTQAKVSAVNAIAQASDAILTRMTARWSFWRTGA
ncbi:hypothetical protein SPRG_03117 [Saprolegnia parasitica CBS 223.65]|uniref:Vesicle transport v-SNARE N-terminal domain-containing protein n=1 Tax=Saprolegnia parasitica (strain CBS 223.65) TaxID=695850 RepID=A0A067CZF2_SAPPC|nr:hypothetical protein SPRG_03117 [Saprolegnia parasitica CBS 223.65]KDO31901.1 hypothetical protein SPRG_03117 [Saprolegnia parasitica CBS 223.65]|eukprot:XP_012197100.1 hypothetical protein SPRG_03117 [Saprolegnia parasitica CBS 223.65]